MATFQYRALQTNGAIAEGVIEAGGRQEAFRLMEDKGLRPVSLAEKANGKARKIEPRAPKPQPMEKAPEKTEAAAPKKAAFSFGAKKISPRALENFTRLLSSLLAAGVPLSRALVILTKEASSPAAAVKWKEIHDSVVDGMALADAMARSPETFPRVYVAMVEAGETGGFLDVVLAQIADFQGREKELQGKVLTALMYPAILLVLAIGVLIFLLVFFIPRFQLVFQGFNAELPQLTQMIVGVSEAVRHYGLFLVAAIVV